MSAPFSAHKSREFSGAIHRRNMPLVKSLSLDPEVNLNIRDLSGWTPFFYACDSGRMEIVRYLLDFKERTIDLNLKTDLGTTPFSHACHCDQKEIVEVLLGDERIDLNATNNNESTPLWRVSFAGNLGVVKMLLASGRQIDTTKRNTYEGTAAEIAKKRGHDDISLLLESFEKDPKGIRHTLRVELRYPTESAADIFALIVYLSDDYLQLKKE
jgi:ankyrin repeat protein